MIFNDISPDWCVFCVPDVLRRQMPEIDAAAKYLPPHRSSISESYKKFVFKVVAGVNQCYIIHNSYMLFVKYVEGELRYNPKKHRLPVCEAAGILAVDKPLTWTSFDVVNFVRSRFNVPKVGHCGTLDPAATGLLLLVLGRFTSLSGRLSGEDKAYDGTLTLGVETDSGDLDGKVIRRSETLPDEAQVREVIAGFRGKSQQLPPMYSAVKVGGKKLYELARQGVEIEREPRDIEISRLEISRMELPEVDFSLDCSKGTYVRTLCMDIGAKLGCGGILSGLRRTRCGRFTLDGAVTLDELKELDQDQFTSLMAERLVRQLKDFGL